MDQVTKFPLTDILCLKMKGIEMRLSAISSYVLVKEVQIHGRKKYLLIFSKVPPTLSEYKINLDTRGPRTT